MRNCKTIGCGMSFLSPIESDFCPDCQKEFGIAVTPTEEHLERRSSPVSERRKHSHYFKNISHLEHLDVYRTLSLFQVTDPCIQHATKKLLCSGKRGAKDMAKDIDEAIDSLTRWKEMLQEDALYSIG